MFALNLLILPVLLILLLELIGFIRAIQRYKSPWLTLALFFAIPVVNFGLYQGVLYIWPDSKLDRMQHEIVERKVKEADAARKAEEKPTPRLAPTPDNAPAAVPRPAPENRTAP